AKYIAGRIPSKSSGSVECLSNIQNLVRSCDRYHSKCVSLSKDRPLPTRILDIENKPIVQTTNRLHGRYVALSYCWGRSGKNILLTKENDPSSGESTFDKFTSGGLRESMLAQTIRDAITVCRSMGIKYLWVDAFCIIQEERDLADFKAEAPMMTEYYSNAYFTLITGSARDCADGFLCDRALPLPAPCELNYSREDLVSGAPQPEGVGTICIDVLYADTIGPILTRAWTFQESELSRRSITFRISQFHIHCLSVRRSEDGDFEAMASLDQKWTALGRVPPSLRDVIGHVNKVEATEYAYRFWDSFISGCTGRKLGRGADKLASTGVVKWTLLGRLGCHSRQHGCAKWLLIECSRLCYKDMAYFGPKRVS
ncbi:heterokaryon incompatibility protein-domain-containing protein, partial [Leptodontidium sp. MPI-SDFR-AT-0119]